jgi:hypothetical protein
MKLPYGLSNFKAVITQGYAYIDKTAYIEQLENDGKYHFLLRPRRFGKSLFISTLEYYYDVQYREDFSQIFGELYIGKHPTSLRNTYQVLFLEFSGIDTNRGEEHIYQRFNDKVEVNLQSFLQRYAYPPQTIAAISTRHSPEAKLEYFFQITNGQQVLLLIDEYDHFANAILASDLSLFKRIMGKGGFVRSFYETIKTATQRGTLDRMFITGVTPLMLDSLTSGFNISENLSLSKHFNAALGFTRQEVTQLLQTLGENKLSDSLFEQLLRDITRCYNGYRFHPQAAETVYNPDMVLYFLKQFDWVTTSYPDRMLDDNIASDYQKIMALFSIGNRDSNYQVLDELITNGTIVAQQQRKFELEKNFGRDDFISLLAYMGFISITGKTISQTLFGIPNHVIQELYYQYFKVEIERRNQLHIANHSLSLAIEKHKAWL